MGLVAGQYVEMTPRKQIAAGVALIVFFFLFLGAVAASAFLPGFAGEFGQACLSLLTSPFLMAPAIFILALALLFAVNGWRRNREGSDWVALDENGIPERED